MSEFEQVFARLRDIMLPYGRRLTVTADQPGDYSLHTGHILKNGQPLWFGGVQINKRYVSYHLMPVYVNPSLLETISPELKKRMQGKSCFNFKTCDETLFSELSRLTEAGFNDYERHGYV